MLDSDLRTIVRGCPTGCLCVPEGEEGGDVELARFVPTRPLSVRLDRPSIQGSLLESPPLHLSLSLRASCPGLSGSSTPVAS